MIETYLLEQLVALKKYGTLSAAAMNLHVAQPSLSRFMKKLEILLDVSLFDRPKNKIILNETGILAAKYAQRILDMQNEMMKTVQDFARSQHILHFGACAHGLLLHLFADLKRFYPDIHVSYDVDREEALLRGLIRGTYQMILLTHPIEESSYYCQSAGYEQLYFSLPLTHRFADRKTLSFADMDGENFLIDATSGFWLAIVERMMPKTRFFPQKTFQILDDVVSSSSLAAFATNQTIPLKTSKKAACLSPSPTLRRPRSFMSSAHRSRGRSTRIS